MPNSEINPARQRLGMGARIVTGFLVVLALMATLAVVGLRFVADANHRLNKITQNHNKKTELANVMHHALRERALSMHALPILTDPFDKDAEIQRFNSFGSIYIDARQKLEALPLSNEENAILAHIRTLTQVAQPEVQHVVDMATYNQNESEIFEHMRSVAMPRQREISAQLAVLIELQQDQTDLAVMETEKKYAQVRNLMIALSVSTLLVGMLIASFVSRRTTLQARQLEDQALYDALTGLANRSLLNDRLAHEIAISAREGRNFAVMLMDLDRFKEINDTLGHDIGDEVLREVSRRIKNTVRAEDTVARLGGDEFVVLLHDLQEQDVSAIADKLLAALDPPFNWQQQSIDLGASIGIALYPSQCQDASSLIRCADIAMYVAKRSGKGFTLYSPEQARVSRSDLSLKSELREAIQTNQLCLHYQPRIEHLTGQAIGLEALVRWNHPQRGFLPPDKFITLAEEGGLIDALTQWVLKTALNDLRELHHQGYRLSMSVNLSARSLQDETLPQMVAAHLESSQIASPYLTLEITESAVMANPDESQLILKELDRMGVSLSIDDFGTGYSSLAYLKQLPVDEIKIDKSFVIDMEENDNDAVIVRSTIDLAHNLGMKVTAEGVETAEAWQTLSILGCDRSQGYYMSRPLRFEHLLAWLQESPWAPELPDPIMVVKTARHSAS